MLASMMPTGSFTELPTPERDVYTVSRLNREARLLLESSFPMLWIEGEISNLARPASGHLYFSLKDAQAQVRCALFRQYARGLGVPLRDGLHVLLRGRVSLYEGRGEYQIIVEHVEDAREGALRRAFEALKLRLAAEGLFDTAHKQPLPRLPRRLGIITSPSGAVIHDVLTTLRRRFPAIPVLLYPVPVQGEGAAEKIAAAIRLAGARADCDALILARGGGSLEDLWAFNDEIVARAIYDCPIPLVCGVGHEIDFTIADFVADARAPTPTAAAELLSPNQGEWAQQFRSLALRLAKLARDRLRMHAQHVDWLSARLVHPRQRLELHTHRLAALLQRLHHVHLTRLRAVQTKLGVLHLRLQQCSPHARLNALRPHVQHLGDRLQRAARAQLAGSAERVRALSQALNTLSPLATLARGYAIVQTTDGAVVRDALAVREGERVTARLAHGELDCRVEAVRAR
jgi:exodeoxyribonuclease VII large subunit